MKKKRSIRQKTEDTIDAAEESTSSAPVAKVEVKARKSLLSFESEGEQPAFVVRKEKSLVHYSPAVAAPVPHTNLGSSAGEYTPERIQQLRSLAQRVPLKSPHPPPDPAVRPPSTVLASSSSSSQVSSSSSMMTDLSSAISASLSSFDTSVRPLGSAFIPLDPVKKKTPFGDPGKMIKPKKEVIREALKVCLMSCCTAISPTCLFECV
ncbi:MAG TPA: hypothetical protein V6C97_30295 [Oculatellaceae cyanobacterium]